MLPKKQKYNIFPNPYWNVHSLVIVFAAFGVIGLVLTNTMLAAVPSGKAIGVVTNSNGEVIVDASVSVTNTKGKVVQIVKTDQTGRFELPKLPPDSYIMNIVDEEYFPAQVNITVNSKNVTIQNITLNK